MQAKDQQPLQLKQLFPFFVQFQAGPAGKIISCGSAIGKIFDRSLTDQNFSEHFEITRPANASNSHRFFQQQSASVLFINCLNTSARLRGQVVRYDEKSYIFIGSLLVSEATTIEKNGLKITDFALHDTTPDVVILHRFREMQLAGLGRKSAALQAALNERDLYSEKAATDPLTGLLNRRAFWEQCEPILSKTDAEYPAVVLALDLDGFKQINDEHGHRAGDRVLVEVSKRLIRSVRASDVVARVGGDEFAVLLAGSPDVEISGLIERLHKVLSGPLIHGGVSYKVSASIGAVAAVNAESLDQLVSDADIAMYNGRVDRTNSATWFTAEMRTKHREQKELTQDLYTALKEGGIQQAYQPIVDYDKRNISAFEVLARWQHPTHGNIGPDKFIDFAQQAGIVPMLDRAMLSAALETLQDWHKIGHRVGMQVNLSGLSVTPDLPEFVAEQMRKNAVPARYLTLELTETWLVQNEKELGIILGELSELGVNLHLDDFGTGFSSLSHLQSMPINGIKIDRSFVALALEDDRSRQLIEATLAISRLLNLEVVAEGIENEKQSQLIQRLGCDFGQGYLYSKPLNRDRATSLLASNFKLAA